jgi:DNA-binding CsgD family transcriptional regulator
MVDVKAAAEAAQGEATVSDEVPVGATVFEFQWANDDYAVFSYPAPGAANAEALSVLTATERALVALLLRGRSAAEIAQERGRSRRTVENQGGVIYRKLKVNSRRELKARCQGVLR